MPKCLGKFFCVLILVGCSKEDPVMTKEAMLTLAPSSGPDKLDVVLARNMNEGISCAEYGEGCLSGHKVRARKLDFIAVEFDKRVNAEAAAKKIHGWTRDNWLFDDVDGEPTLERYVVQYYNAKSFNSSKKTSPTETPIQK